MEILAWVVGTIFVGMVWFFLRKKHKGANNFQGFMEALVAAADEGERAYVAQVSSNSLVPSMRGIALARFASALFPVSAYSVASANGLLPPSYQHLTLKGAQVWNLPSGIALKSIIEKGVELDLDVVKADQLSVVNIFIDLFNSGDPSAAIAKLAPVWQQVLSADNVIPDSMKNMTELHSVQYVTAGMKLFSQWYEAITGANITS